MDDWQMAELALKAVRTAARLAEQEQRRRQRASRESAARKQSTDDKNAPRRQPTFEMPTNADGDIPDEFLPQV